jgi:hypothetical protein
MPGWMKRPSSTYAIKTLSEGGTVKVNIPHRIDRVCGCQLTPEGANGSRAMAAMFDFMGRLYQIGPAVPPGGNQFELTRFRLSLVFERGVSNPRRLSREPRRSGRCALSNTAMNVDLARRF